MDVVAEGGEVQLATEQQPVNVVYEVHAALLFVVVGLSKV